MLTQLNSGDFLDAPVFWVWIFSSTLTFTLICRWILLSTIYLFILLKDFSLSSQHSLTLVAHYYFPLFVFVILSTFPVNRLIFVIIVKFRLDTSIFRSIYHHLAVYLDWIFLTCFHDLVVTYYILALVKKHKTCYSWCCYHHRHD